MSCQISIFKWIIAHISINLKKYTKTKEEASLDLKIEKTKVMQQAILQLDIFKKLGALQSSSRFIDAGACSIQI
jgi:hypothetical protein